MIFSGRQYLAVSRMYCEMFAPIPLEVVRQAAESGQAPALMDALFAAIEQRRPIKDWAAFEQRSRELDWSGTDGVIR